MLEKLFKLKQYGTNPRTELIAGCTTFLTMSYILAVNPVVLAAAGMDKGAVFVATGLAAIIGTLIMAFVANWPVGMAPGMGLNAFFAYTIVLGMGYTWQQALGAVFVSGVIFILLTVTGLRRKLVEGVPQSLRGAIIAGIGLFLGFIALRSAGLIVPSPATTVALGNLASFGPLMALLGFFLIVVLDAWRVKGSVFLGIMAITILSFICGKNHFTGIFSMPPSVAPTFLHLDLSGVLHKGIIHLLLVCVLVELFDATGVLIAVGRKAGLLDRPDGERGLSRALFSDSAAIIAGSLVGTSSTTAFVESVSGVTAGGRTGLTSLVLAILFALALFFSPLILAIPAYATAPALIFVACLMLQELTSINWKDLTDSVPAALVAIMTPLTYSIADGMAFGFVSYALLKLCTGKARQVPIATWIIAILFAIRFTMD